MNIKNINENYQKTKYYGEIHKKFNLPKIKIAGDNILKKQADIMNSTKKSHPFIYKHGGLSPISTLGMNDENMISKLTLDTNFINQNS